MCTLIAAYLVVQNVALFLLSIAIFLPKVVHRKFYQIDSLESKFQSVNIGKYISA